MEKRYSITFSPTGTSRFAAEKIAQAFGGGFIAVDLCREEGEEIQAEPESVCIVSVPCYGGRIPPTAAERLARIHGRGTPAVVCVTYGNRAFEDALLELADCVEANGFRVIAGAAVAGEHNIMPQYGAGRPDALDQKELEQFSCKAAQKWKQGGRSRPKLPGSRPYKEYHAATMEILVDKNACTGCGACAEGCPVQAIAGDGLSANRERCIGCMRCIKICPRHCRSLREEAVAALVQRVGKACEGRKENQFYL